MVMSASSEPEQQRAWPTRLLGGAISVFCARPRLMLWLMLVLMVNGSEEVV